MSYRVGVAGATGMVGQELLKVLEKRKFPVHELIPFASERSEGKPISFGSEHYSCQVFRPGCFEGVHFTFFDVSDELSRVWVPRCAEEGCFAIDNSSVFRRDDRFELVVPEINGEAFLKWKKKNPTQRIVTGPNCAAVPLALSLKPLQDLFGIKRVVVSTYQSASGAGAEALTELKDQAQDLLNGKETSSKVFPAPLAFNVIPQIGRFDPSGVSGEESKVMFETARLLEIPNLRISVTAVRVPTLRGHCESVNVELEKPFEMDRLKKTFLSQPGLEWVEEGLPMPRSCANENSVQIGRFRRDHSVESGINYWIASDNLLKGAALNAVQIAELISQS